MVGLALFDLDNTLLDREAAFSRWARGFAEEHRLPEGAVSLIEQADGDGLTHRQTFFETIRETFGIPTSTERLVARYHRAYPACFEVPAETIASMRKLRGHGWKLGVVTNGPPSQRQKLESADLVGEVDALCISEEVGADKPDPVIFEEAALRCGVPLRGWMVGDSATADIAGGCSAGLRTVWMSRHRAWTSTDLVPDAIAVTIPQAVDIILGTDPVG